jgi:type III pantothenate kinase
MLLAIDIGNTQIVLGLFDKDKLLHTWSLSSNTIRTVDEYWLDIRNLIEFSGIDINKIDQCSIGSVVPKLTKLIDETMNKYFRISPLIVASGVKTGIKIRIDNPKEVGADRIANAVAAHHLYKKNVIAVDMGTATTFDIITENGEYIGGVIAPGIDMIAESMSAKTALLPQINVSEKPPVIGKSTTSAMQSGLLNGYLSIIEGITRKVKTEFNDDCIVVATGGRATLIGHHTAIFDDINPYLTLDGLRIIFENNI